MECCDDELQVGFQQSHGMRNQLVQLQQFFRKFRRDLTSLRDMTANDLMILKNDIHCLITNIETSYQCVSQKQLRRMAPLLKKAFPDSVSTISSALLSSFDPFEKAVKLLETELKVDNRQSAFNEKDEQVRKTKASISVSRSSNCEDLRTSVDTVTIRRCKSLSPSRRSHRYLHLRRHDVAVVRAKLDELKAETKTEVGGNLGAVELCSADPQHTVHAVEVEKNDLESIISNINHRLENALAMRQHNFSEVHELKNKVAGLSIIACDNLPCSSFDTSHTRLKSLQDDIVKLRRCNFDLEQKLMQTKDELDDLHCQYERKKKECERYCEALLESEARCRSVHADLIQTRQTVDTTQSSLQLMQRQKQSLESTVRKLHADSSSTYDHLKQTLQELDGYKQKFEDCKSEMDEMLHEKVELEEQLNWAEKGKARESELRSKLEAQYDVLSTEHTLMENEKAKTENTLKEANCRLQECHQRLLSMEDERSVLKVECDKLLDHKKALQQQVFETKEELSKMKSAYDTLNETSNALSSDWQNLLRENDALKLSVTLLENECSELTESCSKIKHEKSLSDSVLQELRSSVSEFNSSRIEEAAVKDSEYERLQDTVAEKDEEIKLLWRQKEISSSKFLELQNSVKQQMSQMRSLLTEELGDISDKKRQFTSDLNQLREEIELKQRQQKQFFDRQLQLQQSRTEAFQKAHCDQQLSVSNLHNEMIRKLNCEIEELKNQNISLQEELNSARKLINTDEQQQNMVCSQKLLEIQRLELQTQQLMSDLATSRDAERKEAEYIQETEELRSEKESTMRERGELLSKLNQLRDEHKHVEETNSKLNSRLQTGEREIEQLKENVCTVQRAYQEEKRQKESGLLKNEDLVKQRELLQLELAQVKKRVNEHSSTISNMEQAKRDLSVHVDELKRQLVDIEYERQQIRKELLERKREVRNLLSDLRASRSEVAGLSGRLQFGAAAEKQHAEAFRAVKRHLSDVLNERDALRQEFISAQMKMSDAEEEFSKKEKQYQVTIDDLTEAYNLAKDGKANALLQLETKTHELNCLLVRAEVADSRLHAQDAVIANLNCSKREAETKLGDLTCVISETLRLLEVESSGDISIRSSLGFCSNSDVVGATDVETVHSALRDVFARLSRAEQFRVEAEQQISFLKDKLSTMEQKKCTSVSEKEKRLQKLLDDSQQEILRLQKVAAFEESSSNISGIESLKLLQCNLKDMTNRTSAMEQVLRAKETQIQEQKEQLLQCAQKETLISHRNVELMHEVEFANARLLDLEVNKKHLENKLEKMQFLLESTREDKRAEEERTKKILTDLQAKDLQTSLLQLTVDQLNESLKQRRDKEDELSNKVLLLNKQIHELKAKASQSKTCGAPDESDVKFLQQKVDNYRQKIKDLKSQKEKLKDRLSDQRHLFMEVENKALNAESQLSSLHEVLSECKRIEQELSMKLEGVSADKASLQLTYDDICSKLKLAECDIQLKQQQIQRLELDTQNLKRQLDTASYQLKKNEEFLMQQAQERSKFDAVMASLEKENINLQRTVLNVKADLASLEQEQLQRSDHSLQDATDRELKLLKSEKLELQNRLELQEEAFKRHQKGLQQQIAAITEQLNCELKNRSDLINRSIKSRTEMRHLHSALNSTVKSLEETALDTSHASTAFPLSSTPTKNNVSFIASP